MQWLPRTKYLVWPRAYLGFLCNTSHSNHNRIRMTLPLPLVSPSHPLPTPRWLSVRCSTTRTVLFPLSFGVQDNEWTHPILTQLIRKILRNAICRGAGFDAVTDGPYFVVKKTETACTVGKALVAYAAAARLQLSAATTCAPASAAELYSSNCIWDVVLARKRCAVSRISFRTTQEARWVGADSSRFIRNSNTFGKLLSLNCF